MDNRSYNVSSTIYRNEDQSLSKISVFRDTTEFNALQRSLQQAQKMEAVGNLAGGIAHDFNNLLSPIIGMSELLLDDLPRGSLEHEKIKVILNSGMRGAELVRQILTFSRKAEQKRIPVRVQKILKEVLKLIRSTLPADIEIEKNIREDCGLVLADPTQLHQVAMNLIPTPITP